VCLFFEHRLSLTADFAGQPFLLMGWTREVLRDLFGTLDEEGLRMYKDIYLELPKKNTKTTLCAGLVVFCLVSAPGTGTEVYSAATTKDQAGQVFNAAVQMVRSNKSLRERLRVIPSSKRMVRVDDPVRSTRRSRPTATFTTVFSRPSSFATSCTGGARARLTTSTKFSNAA